MLPLQRKQPYHKRNQRLSSNMSWQGRATSIDAQLSPSFADIFQLKLKKRFHEKILLKKFLIRHSYTSANRDQEDVLRFHPQTETAD